MATSSKRQRRKERNRTNAKARTNAIWKNRIKQIVIITLIAAVIVAGLAFAATSIEDLDPGTVTTHGG